MTEPIDQPGEYSAHPAASLRVVVGCRGHRMEGARPAPVTLPSATVTLFLAWGSR
ncbi:hypothetical protein PYK79_16100 [Streptomyces sp. ID05-04B]|uniref:hypothetical protein n=1 Tax=Streptomyces sp. ID05-04B TaxID=3028661 RepID=UPI0029C3F870|nr:hypothetical protein [Streptomyces sp. ID05-04B]MDX5564567.1 hypothetical protein [Streptomyces sp. ID05-04B]